MDPDHVQPILVSTIFKKWLAAATQRAILLVLWAYRHNLPPTISATACVDDDVISGCPQEIEAAWDPLRRGLAEHGLHLNAAKSRMWVPPATKHVFHLPQLQELAQAKLEGLIICGGCLTVEAHDSIPIGSGSYCAMWLQEKEALRPAAPFAHQNSGPASWPASSLVCYARLCQPACDACRALCRGTGFNDALQNMVDHLEHLSPLQWDLSHLATKIGAIGIPQMTAMAAVTRAASLLMAHRSQSTAEAVAVHLAKEKELLYSVIQPHMETPVSAYFSDLDHAPRAGTLRELPNLSVPLSIMFTATDTNSVR